MRASGTGSARVNSPAQVLLASLIGTAIEFFDFYIYANATVLVFPRLFFPKSDPAAATLASFATFALAFLARPIGAALFGHFGDRIGRKTTLVAALLMTILGLLLSLIGIDPVRGAPRFTFGIPELYDGLGFVPVVMGLFGLAEILLIIETPFRRMVDTRITVLWPSREEWKRSGAAIGRGTVVVGVFRYRGDLRVDLAIEHNRVFAGRGGEPSENRCYLNDYVASVTLPPQADQLPVEFVRKVVSGVGAASLAVALMVMFAGAAKMALFAGLVILTAGGALEVTLTALEVVTALLLSVALAVRE